MQVDQNGWLSEAAHCPSSHFNERPDPDDISLLVIHNISLPPGQFGTGCVQQFFSGTLDCSAHPYFLEIADLRVSAPFPVERAGPITQFAYSLQPASHAGPSASA